MVKKLAIKSCGSGYLTNTGVIPSLTTNKDLLIFDELSHASTNIGIKLSSSKSMKFNHNDTNHVEELLKKHRKKYISCFILTEGVFSMDGDTADVRISVFSE